MKRSFSVLLAIALAIGGAAARAQTVVRASGTVANLGDAVSALCNGGQSSADIYAGAGFTGTLTAYTAANTGSVAVPSPGPTASPDFVNAPGGTTYQQTLSTFPGHLHVTLGSSAYVFAAVTTASGGSTTVYITCSAAVSLNGLRGGGGGGNAPSPLPSSPITVSASSPPTIGLNYDTTCFGVVLGKLTNLCTPVPQDTTPPSPGPGITIAPNYPPQISVDQTYSFVWTGPHVFAPSTNVVPIAVHPLPTATAAAPLCPGTVTTGSAPAGAFCDGPFGLPIIIGKTCPAAAWNDGVSCGSSNLSFVKNSGTGNDVLCSINAAAAGALNVGVGCGSVSLQQNTTVGGTLQAEASGNSTKSYVPPIFTAAGAAVNSNFHGSLFSCTFSSSTTCTITAWTGAAVFTAGGDIEGCTINSTGSTSPAASFSFYNPTTTQITILASASQTSTVVQGVCWGF